MTTTARRQTARPARRRRAALALPIVLGLLVAAAPPSVAGREPTPAQKEAELKKVQTRIDKLRKSVNADIEKRDKLSVQLRDSELAVQSARKQLEQTRSQRMVAESRLRELEQEQTEVERDLDAERRALAGQLRAAYVNGREEQLKLLLNQEDPSGFGRMLAYYGYFGRARAERIASISEKLARLERLGDEVATETARLLELEQRQQQELASLDAAKDDRGKAVAAIERDIKNRGGEIKRLQSQASALERLVVELRKALEAKPVARQAPFEPLRGKLPWPVQQGKVLARYGQPRAGGSLRWQGMLIGTDRGARVRAPYPGQVVYADWLPGMGLMMVLDHGGGYMSLYGHNEEIFRKPGDRVDAGEVISSVGDSGGNNQPALYFEVRRGRVPVDPENWLKKR